MPKRFEMSNLLSCKEVTPVGQKTCSLKILALLLPRSDGLSQQSTKNPYSFLPSVKVGTNFTQPHQLPPEPWQSHTGDQNLLFACLSLLSKTETLAKKNRDRCVLNTQLTHLCKDRHLPSARWGKHIQPIIVTSIILSKHDLQVCFKSHFAS